MVAFLSASTLAPKVTVMQQSMYSYAHACTPYDALLELLLIVLVPIQSTVGRCVGDEMMAGILQHSVLPFGYIGARGTGTS